MRRTPSIVRISELTVATVLLVLAGVGNVLAEGVQASAVGLYAGVPGRGGRLVMPRPGRAARPHSAVQRVLITTAENAPDLEMGWKSSARMAMDLDPQGQTDPPAPRYAVVLTETHAEGRLHTVRVHPEDPDTSLPVHPGPTHHENAVGSASRASSNPSRDARASLHGPATLPARVGAGHRRPGVAMKRT